MHIDPKFRVGGRSPVGARGGRDDATNYRALCQRTANLRQRGADASLRLTTPRRRFRRSGCASPARSEERKLAVADLPGARGSPHRFIVGSNSRSLTAISRRTFGMTPMLIRSRDTSRCAPSAGRSGGLATVIPLTPSRSSVVRTSSSLNGLITATMSFMIACLEREKPGSLAMPAKTFAQARIYPGLMLISAAEATCRNASGRLTRLPSSSAPWGNNQVRPIAGSTIGRKPVPSHNRYEFHAIETLR